MKDNLFRRKLFFGRKRSIPRLKCVSLMRKILPAVKRITRRKKILRCNQALRDNYYSLPRRKSVIFIMSRYKKLRLFLKKSLDRVKPGSIFFRAKSNLRVALFIFQFSVGLVTRDAHGIKIFSPDWTDELLSPGPTVMDSLTIFSFCGRFFEFTCEKLFLECNSRPIKQGKNDEH